jgi:hypothetical protein
VEEERGEKQKERGEKGKEREEGEDETEDNRLQSYSFEFSRVYK